MFYSTKVRHDTLEKLYRMRQKLAGQQVLMKSSNGIWPQVSGKNNTITTWNINRFSHFFHC